MTDITAIAAPTPDAAPAGRKLTPAQIQAIRASAQAFEAMAVGQLLQPIFNTVDLSKGPFGGGRGEATWKSLLVDEMGKLVAKGGGIGVADSVFREMIRLQEKTHD